MLFHTPLFVLGFLPLCLGGVFALGRCAGPCVALGWLVCCSVGFYGWWNPVSVPLLLVSIAGNWVIGRCAFAVAPTATPGIVEPGGHETAEHAPHGLVSGFMAEPARGAISPTVMAGLDLATSGSGGVISAPRGAISSTVMAGLDPATSGSGRVISAPRGAISLSVMAGLDPATSGSAGVISAPRGAISPTVMAGLDLATSGSGGVISAPRGAISLSVMAGLDPATSGSGGVISAQGHGGGRVKPGHDGGARRLVALGIALNLALLAWFKYADFFLHIAVPSAPALGVILPLGISFFTFQQIMFLADGIRAPLLPYAGFVTFFPHLIAGPIVRPGEIIPQFTAPGFARPDRANLTEGATVFLLGLGKKLVLADTLAPFADVGFAAASRGDPLTLFEAWYALLAYALQIYFDFSGYSDMAIGLARMLNVRFPINFRSPYQARDIADFWRRWHITLGAFLRDYVYIPLGGNTRRWTLLATMLLCGLWHGAAWNFVLWGGLHGVFLIIHRLWRRWHRPLPAPLAQGLTLLAVVLAWVPFRADSLAAAGTMLRGLAGGNGIALPRMIVDAVPALGAIAMPVPVLPWLGDARTLSFPEVSACLLIGWAIALVCPNTQALTAKGRTVALTAGFAFTAQAMFLAPHVAPFLYFQF